MTIAIEEVTESLPINFSDEFFLQTIKKVAEEKGLVLKLNKEIPKKGKPLLVSVTSREDENEEYELDAELLSNGQTVYLIQQRKIYTHHWGSGGNTSSDSLLLLKNNGDTKKLLQSHFYTDWMTYCDDSEDHTGNFERYTKLYSEDPFARAVLEKLKPLLK